MAKSLFIAPPTSLDSGLTSVCLGLLRALEREGVSVGFYKPFSQSVHRGEALHNDGKDLRWPLCVPAATSNHPTRFPP